MDAKRTVLLALVSVSFAAATVAVPAATSGPPQANVGADKSVPPDEVVIAAQKEKLTQLRKQMEQTEDAFYAEFNKVNTDPEYETKCGLKTRLESHIMERACIPKFVTTATSAQGQYILGMIQAGFNGKLGSLAGQDFRFAPPAIEVINGKMADYRKKVLELARKDAKLQQLANDHLALQKRFEAARIAKYSASWFVPD